LETRRILALTLAIFSFVETAIAASTAGIVSGPLQSSPSGPLGFFWARSVPLSLVGWIGTGVAVLSGSFTRKSRVKSLFVSKGFSGDVYNLMIGMRGSGSRLALLHGMEAPRHRQELAELTGINWKEVDREVSVLETYGLVKVYAQSGSVKRYQVTEQGRLLMKVIEDLQSSRTMW